MARYAVKARYASDKVLISPIVTHFLVGVAVSLAHMLSIISGTTGSSLVRAGSGVVSFTVASGPDVVLFSTGNSIY